MNRKLVFSLICSLLFFIIAFITLNDYGTSWDETIHFRRGQAYVHFFLTGELNYDSLIVKKSLYQNDIHNGDYFIRKDTGHPPLNDEIAALFNYIFHQKLGLLGDIQSHHLFNILASSLLVFIIAIFVYEVLGLFPALISVLTLTTYPLFWAESHFNIKDPPLAAFFTGFIWAFYRSLKNFSIKWLILAILFFSLGLGTKFNIVFAIPVVAIYVVYRYWGNFSSTIQSLPRNYLMLILLTPLISLGILTFCWPFLWNNWFINLLSIIGYYKEIGTVTRYQPNNFYVAGFNTFPFQWILYTSPPIVTLLSIIGLVMVWFRRKENSVYILWCLWLAIPIIRVTLPGTTIYGGVRQILEFLPALAFLSGLGAYQILEWLKNKQIVRALLLLSFIVPILVLFKLHPNENVYFNFLIGGLKGAQSRSFPSWGNSFGNAYKQGVLWLNQNAERGSKLTLIQGTSSNIPVELLRKDIEYLVDGNLDSPRTYFSGIERRGEYIMELSFNDTAKEYNYAWEYTENFLIPVHEIVVDEVTILKIWKNDLDHTKKEKQLTQKSYSDLLNVIQNNNLLIIDLKNNKVLSKLIIKYFPLIGCFPINSSYVELSQDNINWIREKDRIPYRQIGAGLNNVDNRITFYIAGKVARYVRFWFDNLDSCVLDNFEVSVEILN